MGLSNYQLVLLDNLIYLNQVTKVRQGETTIGEVVSNLLYKDGDKSAGIGTGTILQDSLNHYKPGDPEAVNCMMTKEEWIEVLKAIEADPVLCSLTVHKVENHTTGALDGFRAMALTGEGVDENIIIFQGTTSAEEWMEDAVGGYSITTPGQQCALDFVNGLDIVNNKPFVVSGHSKGGNMAQYVALFASDPTIDKCLSFDGQGFSKELCETEEYQEAIKKKGQNLYLIASSGDYVNVLFQSPVPDNHKMYVEANNGLAQFVNYHKPNTVFTIKDDPGSEYDIVTGLNATTKMKLSSVFIQDFISYILETETDVEKKKIAFDGLMGFLAAEAESEDEIELGISGDLVLALWAMPLLAGYSGVLAAFGMDQSNFGRIGFKEYMDILDDITAEVYQGVLYKAVSDGALNLLIGYLGDYITASTNNLYTAAALVEDVVKGDAFESWGDMGKSILNLFWGGVVHIFDTTTGGSLEKYLNNMYNSFAVTSTLGEGSKGVVYRKGYEHGGILHIGTGENERSIVGTKGDDILFGGNGADAIYGGAGNDTLWGGRGDDLLYGGSGSNRYVFGLYDGWDVIVNENSGNLQDFVVFTEDVKFSDVSFAKEGMDLLIIVGEFSRIRVKEFFERDGNGRFSHAIDMVQFRGGGEEIDFQTICRRAGVEYKGDVMTELVDCDLTEEEKKALQEEDERLRAWFDDYYNKKNQPGAGNSNNGEGSGDQTSGNEGNSGTGGSSSSGGSSGSSGSGGTDAGANAGNSTGQASYEIFGNDPGAYDDAGRAYPSDPIVIDLNGDGIFTTSLEDGTYFDLNKDGFAEKTAWITPQDALLVRDVNGNGRIDDGGELFGDRTVLSDGSIAETGFQALSDLDENQDGVLDALDKHYQELKIWVDANHNGISEAEELYTLDYFGIESIDLDYNQINRVDENGNLIKANSNIYGQNTKYAIGEYGFHVDHSDTEYKGEEIDTSGLESGLPEIKGCGTLLNLSQAMALNDELKEAVLKYVEEKDYIVKKGVLQDILFLWAGVSEIETDSRGNMIDARKLGVLEKVYGRPFVGVSGANPNSAAAAILNQLYYKFEAEAEGCLLSQSVYKQALEKIRVYGNTESGNCSCDFVPAILTLTTEYPVYYIPLFLQYVLNFTYLGELFDKQYIYEQVKSENEVLAEYINIDQIEYKTKNSYIVGSSRNDLLLSGKEDEFLQGGRGDDTYFFNIGDGQDTITEGKGNDRIVFGKGIREEDIRVSRNSHDLYLTNLESGDRITVQNFFANQDYIVEEVIFTDGTRWGLEEIYDKARYYYGTDARDIISASDSNPNAPSREDDYIYGGAGDDLLSGNSGNDELYGEAGNDTLNGGTGDDLLVGGTGNDNLNGGEGDDTYFFNLGDGQDTITEGKGNDRIVFGEGIREEDIRISRDSRDLYLTNLESGDRITVKNFFGHADYIVEEVAFADGTVWSLEEIYDRARYYYGTDARDIISAWDSNASAPSPEDDYIYGGAGDDLLSGNSGNDELYGEAGNDTLNGGTGDDLLVGGTGNDNLNGGAGDDTYLFNVGDGQDTITEGKGNDRIVFGEGIHEEDIRISRDSRDLYLTNLESGDRITVKNFFGHADNIVEEVAFADGTVWSLEEIYDRARYYYGTDARDIISAWDSNASVPSPEDDYIYGGAGDDLLSGNSGNDELYGEAGNDTLNGGTGDDLLVGGTGNDNLNGGAGDDTYLFNIGDGQDTITEGKGNDRIVFGEGIREEDIRISRDSRDLYLTNLESGDRITVKNFFSNADYIVEEVAFADGTVWSLEEIYDKARYYYGTEGNDSINASDSNQNVPSLEDDYIYGGAGDDRLYGNSGNDKLYGEAGNDTLNGGTGDDLLVGGTGNDNLNGGAGDDTYLFNIGDGQDTITEGKGNDRIVYGEGIREEDIRISRDSRDLYLTNLESGDRITVKNFFSNADYIVEEVAFADGTVWSLEEIYDKARYYYGTEGNDSINASDSSLNAPSLEDDYIYGGAGDDRLYGNSGNDELYGEAGNDTLNGGTGDDLLVGGTGNDNLNGGEGDDTYLFNVGDGQDTITEGKGNDRIVFGEGIREEDIRISRDSRDLYLTNLESGDRITVKNFFGHADYIVEEVAFADGTVWSLEEIYDRARYYYGTDARDIISAWDSNASAPSPEDDYIYGGAGDDLLSGNSGNDELYGEAGNDTLNGGTGDDLLVGGTGNDNLNGGAGDDTYLFNIGDGQDTITEGKGNDRIVFGEGIEKTDLVFSREQNHLKIFLAGREDTITVSNHFGNEDYRVESFQTADGSVLDYTKLNVMIQAMASFEESTGMMWEEAVTQKNQEAEDLISQWWTKEVV